MPALRSPIPLFAPLVLLLAACAADPLTAPSSDPAAFDPPPSFIVLGEVDEENEYGNTGAFIVKSPTTGRIFPICSGTLISPTVFLTAAHCTQAYLADLKLRGFSVHVSFDNPIPFGPLTNLKKTKLIAVQRVVTNPAFHQRQDDSGDIGVLILPSRATRGIAPASLPTLGLLDGLAAQDALRDAAFTAVGYGLQDRVVGGGEPFFENRNPVPRMFSFPSFSALNPGYLRLSQNEATGDGGTCFGDSGGPNFLDVNGRRILAASTVTGDTACEATNVTYRLDTPSARSFLGKFVALP